MLWRGEESSFLKLQLTHTKAAEIQEYLRRLSDTNSRMSACLSGTSDARSHFLSRHRDVLHDYTQAYIFFKGVCRPGRSCVNTSCSCAQPSQMMGLYSGIARCARPP